VRRTSPRLERPLPPTGDLVRLDTLVNPFGPPPPVVARLTATLRDGDELDLTDRVKRAVARHAGTSSDRVVIANGMEDLLDAVMLWRRDRAPFVTFPPTDPAFSARAANHGITTLGWDRHRPTFGIGPGAPSDLPAGTTAHLMSPNDPTGTLVDPIDLVQVARACELVVVDERHGAYAGRSAAALASEFDNVLICSTLSTWAGLTVFPFAWATGPAPLVRSLAAYLRPDGVATATLADALADIAGEGTID